MRPKSPTFLLAATLLLAAASPSRAQLDNLLTGYSLTSWNEGDGHPLGTVYAMVQDPQGYLWLGTDAGLFRFDGSRFTAWNTMSDAPLPPVAVVALCVTRRGNLLVGLAEEVAQDFRHPQPKHAGWTLIHRDARHFTHYAIHA